MRSLAVSITVGWFWLMFYGVGPLTSRSQFAVAGLGLAAGCVLAVAWGVVGAARLCRRPPTLPSR